MWRGGSNAPKAPTLITMAVVASSTAGSERLMRGGGEMASGGGGRGKDEGAEGGGAATKTAGTCSTGMPKTTDALEAVDRLADSEDLIASTVVEGGTATVTVMMMTL